LAGKATPLGIQKASLFPVEKYLKNAKNDTYLSDHIDPNDFISH